MNFLVLGADVTQLENMTYLSCKLLVSMCNNYCVTMYPDLV